MVFFEAYLLCSYNAQIGTRLLMDCGCYADYAVEELFIERIINERKSYLACITYDSQTRKRVGHRSIPIMLGSYIDYRIRGKAAVERSRAQWGAVILKGMLKIYTSFSTFDALSMHVRETNERKSIEWFTYVDGEGVALCYSNKTVEWTYKNESRDHLQSREWIDLINRANPFVKHRHVQPSEYVDVFDKILEYPYDMNDLKNRQFLIGVTIINKYIDYDLAKRKRKKGAGCVKMATAFESGSLYTVLSKKNTYETEEWCKTYPQNYDNTLHEGRSNKTAHFLQNVTRASNEAFRNSKAVEFPTDAFDYFCILNTKELKSAGEQNVLADFVVMTEETDPMEVYAYVRRTSTGVGEHILINGFNGLSQRVDVRLLFGHETESAARDDEILQALHSVEHESVDTDQVFGHSRRLLFTGRNDRVRGTVPGGVHAVADRQSVGRRRAAQDAAGQVHGGRQQYKGQHSHGDVRTAQGADETVVGRDLLHRNGPGET